VIGAHEGDFHDRQLQGPHTSFNFTWVPSGDPNDPHELIRDFSITPQGH